MDEQTTSTTRPVDAFRVASAARLDDLLAAVRMSWDEVFDLPEPRPLASSAA
jgi:hypothetical protein